MAITYATILGVVSCIVLMIAAQRLIRQARRDRTARIEAERQRQHSDQLQRLTATLSRARTPVDVIHVCLPDLLHASAATAGAPPLVSDDAQEGGGAAAHGAARRTAERGRRRAG